MAMYNAERKRILNSLQAENVHPEQNRFSALAGLTKLRRLVCHPRLVDDTTTLDSARMDRIVDTIQDLVGRNQRALVFSQFTSYLSLLQHELQRVGVGHLYLDGSSPQQLRAQLVTKWHEE